MWVHTSHVTTYTGCLHSYYVLWIAPLVALKLTTCIIQGVVYHRLVVVYWEELLSYTRNGYLCSIACQVHSQEYMHQYRCMYSQHWTIRNTLPSTTTSISTPHAWIVVCMVILCIADTDSMPEDTSRSVLSRVSVLEYRSTVSVAPIDSTVSASAPTLPVLA